MQVAEVFIDAYGRIHDGVERVLDGVDPHVLGVRLDPQANSIAWLVWHLTRVQDDHIASAFDCSQVWVDQDWVTRFGLPFPVGDHGYGHTADQVGMLAGISADLLRGYHEATWRQTVTMLTQVTPESLDRIVDTRWTPPVTLGVRLISVINDDLEHLGQAAFIRGCAERAL
ncbi:MAG: DinB family protein [Propionibacteriaceae bacterium]|nr:DinB family protein [Propionibacteriaceae bacterium]